MCLNEPGKVSMKRKNAMTQRAGIIGNLSMEELI
jgi:hypothetical protein